MLTETTANMIIKPDLPVSQRQTIIVKNANAAGWVIATMYIFGPAPRESISQECRIPRELNYLSSLTYRNNYEQKENLQQSNG